MALPIIDTAMINQLLQTGQLTVAQIKAFVEKIMGIVKTLQELMPTVDILAETGAMRPPTLVTGAVTEDTIAEWKPVGRWLTNEEFQATVKKMAEEMAAEKWTDGFISGLTLAMTIVGGGV